MAALPGTFPVGTTYYYAKWTAQPAQIVFDAAGGTLAEDDRLVVGADGSGTMEGVTDGTIADRTMPSVSSEGYTFDGWFAKGDDGAPAGDAVTQLPAGFPVGTTSYVAAWSAAEAKIVFDINPTGNPKLDDVAVPEAWVGKTDAATGKDAWPEVVLPEDVAVEFEFVEWQDA